jgi:hypothetical protein
MKTSNQELIEKRKKSLFEINESERYRKLGYAGWGFEPELSDKNMKKLLKFMKDLIKSEIKELEK